MRKTYWTAAAILTACAWCGGQTTAPRGGVGPWVQPAAEAQSAVDQADKATDPAQRDQLLVQASQLYEKALAAIGAKPANEDAVLQQFDIRLKLADTVGRRRCEMEGQRLTFLRACGMDRQRVVELTAGPIKALRELGTAVDETMMNYRSDNRKRMRYMSKLEEFAETIKWQGSQMRLMRGMALNDQVKEQAGEKRTVLNEMIASLKGMAEGAAETGVKFRANLRIAQAYREMRQYDKALAALKAAAADEAPDDVKVEAACEKARLLCEQGVKEAQAAIDEFAKVAAATMGDKSAAIVAMQTVLLQTYLFETRAARQTDPAKAKEDQAAAQKAMLDYANKFTSSEDLGTLMEVAGWKYQDRPDRENLSSLTLVAIARLKARQETPEAEKEAMALLAEADKRDDPVSREARPMVLWEMASQLYKLKRPDEAGRKFAELNEKFPQSKLAKEAAGNAAGTLGESVKQLEQQKQPVPTDLRKEYIAALEGLVGRSGDDPQIAAMYYDLGNQYFRLARASGPGSEDRKRGLAEAIKNFQKVAPASENSLESRFWALDCRYELAAESDANTPKAKTEAQSLAADMNAFAADAGKAAADANANKDASARLKKWSEAMAFAAVRVRYEKVKDETALRDLFRLVQGWKDNIELVQEAKSWEIRTLIDSKEAAKISDAIAKVDAFRKEYPEKAQEVVRPIVQSIRDRINALKNDTTGAAAADLGGYRKAYLDFARDLFEKDKADTKTPPDQLYSTKQMYGDALCEAGQGAQALAIWQECAKEDEDRRKKLAKEIDDEIDRRVAAVNAARSDYAKLTAIYDEYWKVLSERKMPTMALRPQLALRARDATTQPGASSDARKVNDFADAIINGWNAMRAPMKTKLEVDAFNVLGLARSLQATKQYADAYAKYFQLAQGIDPKDFPDFFWEVQEELCECWLQGFRQDKEKMQTLSVYIRQLQATDPQLHGRVGKFNLYQAEAEKAAKR